MQEHIKSYKEKLKKGICEYMDMPVSERSASAINEMLECLDTLNNYNDCKFTMADAEQWNAKMVNADGTMGGHWTIEQTNRVANDIGLKFEHITDFMFNATMNMMYSDYSLVADKFGVNTTEYFGTMAKAFLFDTDGGEPAHKLAMYYNYIVK